MTADVQRCELVLDRDLPVNFRVQPTQSARTNKVGLDTAELSQELRHKSRLSPEQYEVTQRNGTESPFKNAYWDSENAVFRYDP